MGGEVDVEEGVVVMGVRGERIEGVGKAETGR